LGLFLGKLSPSGGVIAVLENIPALLSGIEANETVLALFTVSILFFIPKKFKQHITPPLVALVGFTVISVIFLVDTEVRRICGNSDLLT